MLEDVARAYDLHLSDRHSFGDPTSPLITPSSNAPKWHRTVSIGALNAVPHKVLLMGSLFSSTKIDTVHPEAGELREMFDQSLAFRNPWLMRPANEVAARLGNGYLGVHARVGDGAFQRNSQENMEEVWDRLVHQMEVDPEVRKAVWEQVKPLAKDKAKRNTVVLDGGEVEARADGSTWHELDDAFGESELYYFDETNGIKHKHTVHKRAQLDVDPSAPPALRELTCRAPLHTAPELLAFNKPLYLATDSRNPAEDPALAIFFHTFPCTFVLNDFDRPSDLNEGVVVESVQQMSRLENENDGMPLGRLFLPFLEAVIAAKANLVSGTPGSTFSSKFLCLWFHLKGDRWRSARQLRSRDADHCPGFVQASRREGCTARTRLTGTARKGSFISGHLERVHRNGPPGGVVSRDRARRGRRERQGGSVSGAYIYTLATSHSFTTCNRHL